MTFAIVLNLAKTVLKAVFKFSILSIALLLIILATILITIIREKETHPTKIQKPIALLKKSKQRHHNQTQLIENATLITPTPKLQLALPSSIEVTQKSRNHNQTKPIENNILVTPAPLETQKAKRKKTSLQKPQNPRKQPLIKPEPTSKDFPNLTTKELLKLAKDWKIKGYSTVYKLEKKPGLIRLLNENSVA